MIKTLLVFYLFPLFILCIFSILDVTIITTAFDTSCCLCCKGAKIVTVLPGSRLQEVTRMLPIFSKTMDLLKASIPDVQAVMHVAPNKHVEGYISSMTHQWPVPIVTVPGSSVQLKYDAFCVRNRFGPFIY